MTAWRIYRVPGSRQWWHIDSGPNTPIVSVKRWRAAVATEAVDVGGAVQPRAWIKVLGEFFMFPNGEAVFQ